LVNREVHTPGGWQSDRVTALISHTTFDSRDAYAMSVFWAGILGFAEDPDDPNLPGHEECMIFSADGGQRLLFIEVPDDKQVKNRVHLDLKPAEGTRDEELERLLRLGARQVADHRRPDGTGWVTLADPEGNEFCIVRSDAERAATA
jgi:catechol 2,3-dioxygenase-like lactoylglutathione lyase family enzyme